MAQSIPGCWLQVSRRLAYDRQTSGARAHTIFKIGTLNREYGDATQDCDDETWANQLPPDYQIKTKDDIYGSSRVELVRTMCNLSF